MGYQLDLDEIDESKLRRELHVRAERRMRGLCDYCARPRSGPPCKLPERHAIEGCRECGSFLQRRDAIDLVMGTDKLCATCAAREED